MSMFTEIIQLFNNHVENYINSVSEHYGMDKQELLDLWNEYINQESGSDEAINTNISTNTTIKKSTSTTSKTKSASKKKSVPPTLTTKKSSSIDTIDFESLSNMKKPELILICKKYSLKVSGNKQELINSIIKKCSKGDTSTVDDLSDLSSNVDEMDDVNGIDGDDGIDEIKPKKPTKKSLVKSSTKSSVKPIKKSITPVVKKATNGTSIVITKNSHGKYEHTESGIVFDTNRKAIGTQGADGKIIGLTEDDIDICNQFKFLYDIPENLDTSSSSPKKKADKKIVVTKDDDDDNEDIDNIKDEEELNIENLLEYEEEEEIEDEIEEEVELQE
jgi:hypothetical protein